MNSGIARFALGLGLVACLLPALAKELDWSPHAMHSDLWFGVGVYVVVAFADVWGSGSKRIPARMIGGLLAILIAAVNIPDLLEVSQQAEESAVKGFLAEAARERMFSYMVLAMSGLMLLVTSLAAWSRQREAKLAEAAAESEMPQV